MESCKSCGGRCYNGQWYLITVKRAVQNWETLLIHNIAILPYSPVLRSLARLRPNMTLEDGIPRAVQEWEHSSNFERMIFYEMAEK